MNIKKVKSGSHEHSIMHNEAQEALKITMELIIHIIHQIKWEIYFLD